jgi:dipeptidyl aminopeptidase/acylaminoacyl peptidase
VLVSGNDFYATPRLSPDGGRLAWITWNHPNMPWDGTLLWVAPVEPDGRLGPADKVAGGSDESIFQPAWSPSGVLHWVWDLSGWWNLYRRQMGSVEALRPMEAEFGAPLWSLGTVTYGFAGEHDIVCSYRQAGRDRIAVLNTGTRSLQPIELPFTSIDSLKVGDGFVVFRGGMPTEPASLVRLDLISHQQTTLRQSSTLHVDACYISVAEHVEFPTADGQTAHGYFYAPANRDFAAPTGERPPLLVKSHGGPTGNTSDDFDAKLQYWTSRGIAVLDVDYRGSTGYGRAYRMRLNGQWGVADVDDCVFGAKYLVQRGAVDGNRLMIDGGSAGGYTTLAVLTFRDTFRAGASYYGISDLETMAKDTHKFESRYLDTLVGPYPEALDRYRERSPIYHTDRLNCPLILFQGLEDQVVPPAQAETMFAAVKAKGLPVAYLPFEGEQHGFRQAANIKRALDAELYFYGKVFGFTPADAIEPVEIANLG